MSQGTTSRYRSRAIADNVIGLSISYERESLLSRGLGLEHLREMLLRLARPILRQGASLAYGGNWKETEDNFTYDLMRLITAEQEDNSLAGPDTNLTIGRLYNHMAWPYYLEVTPQLEAQWINSNRVIRVTQRDAGFPENEIVPDSDAWNGSQRSDFNRAVTLSVMRRHMLQPLPILIPEGTPETIPPVVARVTLGGKTRDFSGFMPGIFEEALTTLDKNRPLFLLGGFGGATEVLSQAILHPERERPPELTVDWHVRNTKGFADLLKASTALMFPCPLPQVGAAFDQLWGLIVKARGALSTLNTGLDDSQTRELLTTRDMNAAIRLVRSGLTIQRKLPNLPA